MVGKLTTLYKQTERKLRCPVPTLDCEVRVRARLRKKAYFPVFSLAATLAKFLMSTIGNFGGPPHN